MVISAGSNSRDCTILTVGNFFRCFSHPHSSATLENRLADTCTCTCVHVATKPKGMFLQYVRVCD